MTLTCLRMTAQAIMPANSMIHQNKQKVITSIPPSEFANSTTSKTTIDSVIQNATRREYNVEKL